MKKFVLFLFLAIFSSTHAAGFSPAAPPPVIAYGAYINYGRAFHSGNLANGAIENIELNVHSIQLQDQGYEIEYPSFNNFHGDGINAGVCLEYFLGGSDSSGHSIIVKFGYTWLPSETTISGTTYSFEAEYLPGKTENVLVNTSHRLRSDVEAIVIDVYYNFELFNTGFFMFIGPTIRSLEVNTLEQEFFIESPSNIVFKQPEAMPENTGFADYGRRLVYNNTDEYKVTALRVGFALGAEYKFDLGRVFLVPNASVDFSITKMTVEKDWYMNVFSVGMDLRVKAY